MKFLPPLVNFLLIISTLYSCKDQGVLTSPSTLKGQIANPTSNLVSISFEGATLSQTINSGGQFEFSIPIERPTFLYLNNGSHSIHIYLTPAESLEVSFDALEFIESLKYEGSLARENSLLAKLSRLNHTLPPYNEIMSLDQVNFLALIDSLEAKKEGLLNRHLPVDAHFKKVLLQDFLLFSAVQKMYYPGFHPHYANLDSFKVSDDYYRFQKEIDLNNTSFLESKSFLNYSEMYIDHKMRVAFDEQTVDPKTSSFELYHQLLDKEINLIPIKRELKYKWLTQHFTDCSDSIRNQVIRTWKAMEPKLSQVAVIDSLSQEWSKLAMGQLAPGFRFNSITSDTLSLSDFRGKFVYIDVWATWCGPCLEEQPALAKMQGDLKGEEVVFLTVSIDESPEPWRKMVLENEWDGVHLYAGRADESSFMKDYMVGEIPRYILIDQAGKIIDANAYRPSQDIQKKLLSLIAKAASS